MVTGTTRQVIIIKGSGKDIFDQAIFLVRDNVISSGGISEKELLNEARQIYQTNPSTHRRFNLMWAALGAVMIAIPWLITAII